MNKNIIVVSGKKGSGKDTFADIFIRKKLIKELSEGTDFSKIVDFEKLSFAQPIKEILSIITDKTVKELDENKNCKLKFEDKTVRDYYRLIADSFKKIFDENIWVRLLVKKIDKNKRYIITDLRFKNEYGILLEKFNPVFIRIKRNVEEDNHISETSLDDLPDSNFDFIINNTGNIENLKREIDLFIEKLDKL